MSRALSVSCSNSETVFQLVQLVVVSPNFYVLCLLIAMSFFVFVFFVVFFCINLKFQILAGMSFTGKKY